MNLKITLCILAVTASLCFTAKAQNKGTIAHFDINSDGFDLHEPHVEYIFFQVHNYETFLGKGFQAVDAKDQAFAKYDRSGKLIWSTLTNFPYGVVINTMFHRANEPFIRVILGTGADRITYEGRSLQLKYPTNVIELRIDTATGACAGIIPLLYGKDRSPFFQQASSVCNYLKDATISVFMLENMERTMYAYSNDSAVSDSVRSYNTWFIYTLDERGNWYSNNISSKPLNTPRSFEMGGLVQQGNHTAFTLQFKNTLYLDDKEVARNTNTSGIGDEYNVCMMKDSGKQASGLPTGRRIYHPFKVTGDVDLNASIGYLKADGSMLLKISGDTGTLNMNGKIRRNQDLSYQNLYLFMDAKQNVTETIDIDPSYKYDNLSLFPDPVDGTLWMTLGNAKSFRLNGKEIATPDSLTDDVVCFYKISKDRNTVSYHDHAFSKNGFIDLRIIDVTEDFVVLNGRMKIDIKIPSVRAATISAGEDYNYVRSNREKGKFVPGTSGIRNTTRIKIDVYPNPVTAGGIISISGNTANTVWQLTSTDGRIINLSNTKSGNNIQLTLPSSIQPGLYILKGTGNNGILYDKIIVR